jgi:hypothetical protein
LELAGHFRDCMCGNGTNVLHVRVDQRMLAKEIHDPRNSVRIHVHGFDRLLREDRFPVRPGPPQAFGDVPVSFR